MSDLIEEYQRRLRKALQQIQEMSVELKARDAEQREPIAIIGMACRFPGNCSTPADFFQFLMDGNDAVTEIPMERRLLVGEEAATEESDTSAARWGAFLPAIEMFDASFFEISPREAARMDPQHRLLLEVAWESLENAGVVIDPQRKKRTGLFVGITSTDYSHLSRQFNPSQFDLYDVSGNGHCFSAGRIAYHLDLQGPCVAVDTACSSSLVATHLACQSLRLKECDVALVGGVNLLLAPRMSRAFARAHASSPTGRTRTFDAQANGFVRSEGCGAVVLMRQSQALQEGFRIWASLLGSSINQDGRSVGFTAPSMSAQQSLIREALLRARVKPHSIGFIETHGTGTALGDPIEADALANVFAVPREDTRACYLGALKTNVGHLEAAAGIAGLIKTVGVLTTEVIPKNLHFRTLNPRISLDESPLAIPRENTPWPRETKPRIAGVSSFGMSGTNAHVIVEEPPVITRQIPAPHASAYLLPISAKSPDALAASAQKYAHWFARNNAVPLGDIVYTAAVRRAHHDHRAFVVAGTHDEFATILKSITRENALSAGRSHTTPQKIAFVFPGQGSQWLGMGRRLVADEPVFRKTLEACDAAIRHEAEFSVLDEIAANETTSRLNDIAVVQPVLFAIAVALAALWRSWGIEPDCVIGHSMGEVAAAHVAGALSLQDAAMIVCRRSRLLRNLRGKGAMALVELTVEDVEKELSGYDKRVGIAVVNGPKSTVIAGDPPAIDEILAKLERAGIFCQRVNVDVASHSPQIDALYNETIAALSSCTPGPLQIPMRSTTTGKTIQGSELGASYWADNLRNPVLFWNVVQQWIDENVTTFIEISPHPVLLPFIDEAIKAKNVAGTVLSSLRFKRDERGCLLNSLGTLYSGGCNIDWANVYPVQGQIVELPSYAWQRQRYWIDPAEPIHRTIPQPTNAAILPAQTSTPAMTEQPSLSFRERMAALPPTEHERFVEDHVLEQTGQVVKLHASQINPRAPFSTLGIDSLMSLELRNRLERELLVKLPATLIFSFPTPNALVKHLTQELSIAESHQSSTDRETAETADVSSADDGSPEDIEAMLESKLADLDKYMD